MKLKRIFKSFLLYLQGKQYESRLAMLLEKDEVLVVLHHKDGTNELKIAKVEGNLEKALKKKEIAYLNVNSTRYLVHGKPDKSGYFHVVVD